MAPKEPPVWRKLAWFVSLWVASVAALAVVAAIIKTVLG
ncbi:MAG TPA: DUF2474 family protein [Allosphingosinicella sp.]|jgi:hypothetical protein